MNQLLTFVLFAIFAFSFASKFIQVDPDTHYFVDPQGRTRLFHGLNVVYKVPPYLPVLDHFDPALSFSVEDMDDLVDWGFNFIRLGVMWPAVEPERGVFNQTYLDEVQWIVDECEKRGIYVLIDCHQDVLSRQFCGEGAEDWAIVLNNDTKPFPYPLKLEFDFDPETGYPDLDQCLENWFGEYYLSEAASVAFQNLYDNTDGVLDEFGKYWAEIAARFVNSSAVLGYEFINEPWAGDFYSVHQRAKPGYTDLHSLQPMYQILNDYIRSKDQEHIVFYEPVTFDIPAVGFNETPGGPAYDNRQAMSFHCYCPIANDDMSDKKESFCQKYDAERFPQRTEDIQRLGGAGLLTEFGSLGNSSVAIEEITTVCADSEKNFFGWAYWQFKSYKDLTATGRTVYPLYDEDGNVEINKLKALSRTYAQSIAGVPESTAFNSTSGEFLLSYHTNPQITAPTEIYLNEKLWYPNGFYVRLDPKDIASWTRVKPNLIQIFPTSAMTSSQLLVVEIAPLDVEETPVIVAN